MGIQNAWEPLRKMVYMSTCFGGPNKISHRMRHHVLELFNIESNWESVLVSVLVRTSPNEVVP
jgi:hypothetical protein